jgi:hypothetical protein
VFFICLFSFDGTGVEFRALLLVDRHSTLDLLHQTLQACF